MKDTKDHTTLELPGFESDSLSIPAEELPNTPMQRAERSKRRKACQLDLLAEFGPTDHSGLPAWNTDPNFDLSGLPVWQSD